jgi:hypothetical protein
MAICDSKGSIGSGDPLWLQLDAFIATQRSGCAGDRRQGRGH